METGLSNEQAIGRFRQAIADYDVAGILEYLNKMFERGLDGQFTARLLSPEPLKELVELAVGGDSEEIEDKAALVLGRTGRAGVLALVAEASVGDGSIRSFNGLAGLHAIYTDALESPNFRQVALEMHSEVASVADKCLASQDTNTRELAFTLSEILQKMKKG